MDMRSQLEKLNEVVAAGEKSAARQRLLRFFDADTFVEIDRLAKDGDRPAEVVAGYGSVDGCPVYAFAQDHEVCCGAVGRAQAAKIQKIYALAAQNGAPVVAMFDSDGAKLGEGIDAMDAIADILLAANNLSGVVPQIALIAGPCVGSAALIAANADVTVKVKDADYYLNPGDESAAASVCAEDEASALDKVRQLISLLPANNLAAAPAFEFDGAAAEGQDAVSAMEAAADAGSLFLFDADSDCKTALARIGGLSCGLLALTGDKVEGCACSRLARFIRLCDGFSIPVVSFVDAAGFACLKGAAKLSHAYAEATTAKVTVITGRAYGSVYIAAAGKSAGADAVLAWPVAAISPLNPEAAIHLFWKDRLAGLSDPVTGRQKLAEEYAEKECSALRAAADGAVTDVIAPDATRSRLIALLDMLAGKRVSRLPKKHSNMPL
ncbi:MAG: carboxyl transferase [Clostridiales bacterium]|nr:carboxyl transferase [Clostridiales bacterium]